MPLKTVSVGAISVGHNNAEFYLKLDDVVIILPPSAMKELRGKLGDLHIPTDKPPRSKAPGRRTEPIAKQVLKALYKGKKVTRNLIAINTGRRKKLPDV